LPVSSTERDAVRGLLEQIGIAGDKTAYHSARKGGSLNLIDSRLRRQDHDLDWQCDGWRNVRSSSVPSGSRRVPFARYRNLFASGWPTRARRTWF
jgi:hypothetical protein